MGSEGQNINPNSFDSARKDCCEHSVCWLQTDLLHWMWKRPSLLHYKTIFQHVVMSLIISFVIGLFVFFSWCIGIEVSYMWYFLF